jgi:hypothetical protein
MQKKTEVSFPSVDLVHGVAPERIWVALSLQRQGWRTMSSGSICWRAAKASHLARGNLLRKLDRVEVFRRIHDLETERRSFSCHAAGALDARELDRNRLSLQG